MSNHVLNDTTHQVLLGNVFDHIISKYLTPKDILHLGFADTLLRSKLNLLYIHSQIKKRVFERLRIIFREDYKEFINTMIKTNAIISGSFIIQCVLNEYWDNSDIDIYVSNNNTLQKGKWNWNDAGGASNHFNSVSSGNSLVLHRLFSNISKNTYLSDYKTFGNHIEAIVNYELYNDSKIQVINVNTSDDYTLRDHNRNTGFDICKNILRFNKDKSMFLEFKNLKDIIYRRSLFSILEIDDFYYRIEKYSKRGFYFKPKFNKTLYLEYIMLHFNGYHSLQTNFREDTYHKLTKKQKSFQEEIHLSPDYINGKYYGDLPPYNCGVNCPVKLLFRDARHYHSVWDDPNGNWIGYKVITVENIDGRFDKIIPQLKKCDYDRGMMRICYGCKNSDEWVKLRTAKVMTELDDSEKEFIPWLSRKYAKDPGSYKYDVQYGLPCNPRITLDEKKALKKEKKKEKNTQMSRQEKKTGWTQVSRRK
jgi:hypothetical protein